MATDSRSRWRPVWTRKNRSLSERKGARYPSDLSDAEWALIVPLIPSAKRGGRRREVDVREVLNGVLYVPETGCQWRALPKDLPPKTTVLSCPHRPPSASRFGRHNRITSDSNESTSFQTSTKAVP